MKFEDLEVFGKEIGYLEAEFADASIKECRELSRMLAALIAKRRQFANQAGEELAEYNDEARPERSLLIFCFSLFLEPCSLIRSLGQDSRVIGGLGGTMLN